MTSNSTANTLFVCALCRFSEAERSRDGVSGGQYYLEQVKGALALPLQGNTAQPELSDAIHLHPVRCMAQCHQPCNVALAAPGKLTFIFSGLAPEDSATALAEFCAQYAQSPDGRVPYNARSSVIREATAFVLPPLPTLDQEH